MENNMYVATNGEKIDITTLNTERLINSLAKHHRDIYESKDLQEFAFHSDQIDLIDAELLRRNRKFRDDKIGGGVWK